MCCTDVATCVAGHGGRSLSRSQRHCRAWRESISVAEESCRDARDATPCHSGGVTDQVTAHEWLTIPDLVGILGVGPSRVRRLIEEHQLAAARIDGVLRVPAAFLRGNEPVSELRGTLILLADAGFTDDEAVAWLLEPEDSLDAAPIDALKAGRKAEVRRIAQALG